MPKNRFYVFGLISVMAFATSAHAAGRNVKPGARAVKQVTAAKAKVKGASPVRKASNRVIQNRLGRTAKAPTYKRTKRAKRPSMRGAARTGSASNAVITATVGTVAALYFWSTLSHSFDTSFNAGNIVRLLTSGGITASAFLVALGNSQEASADQARVNESRRRSSRH